MDNDLKGRVSAKIKENCSDNKTLSWIATELMKQVMRKKRERERASEGFSNDYSI